MRIQKKRIHNLKSNLPGITEGTELILAVPVSELSLRRLQLVGFTADLKVGEKVLPSRVGRVSCRNAEGSFIRHRDRPKEQRYRQREWSYNQWHGKGTIEVTKIVDVPYQRYQRTLIPPPAVELSVIELQDGSKAIATSSPVTLDIQNRKRVIHCINLMLELFGLCDVLDKSQAPIGIIPTVSLNWRILPTGEMPWSQLEPHLKRIIRNQKKGNRPVVEHRLKEINRYKPSFVAVGHGGFNGYVIFGFPERDLYILECARWGNATYVFGGKWKELSKLTKAEVLSEKHQQARFIHVAKWKSRIRSLFLEAQAA